MKKILLCMIFLLSACTTAPGSSVIVTPPETEDPAPAPTDEIDIAEEIFDPARDVVIYDGEDRDTFVFYRFPGNREEMQLLIDAYTLDDAENTAAFYIAALNIYPYDAEEALAMIDLLKGPQPLSEEDKRFIKERLSDKMYLPQAYFEGATPENDYTPEDPWTLVIYEDPVEAPEGYEYVYVLTAGADSPRRIVTREKGDNEYLWDYVSTLVQVRDPVSIDPWK